MKVAPRRRDAPLLQKMVDWLLSKMGPFTVRALGERAEVLLALKESLLSAGAIQVLKLMVMAAVSALMMIGALLMKMVTTAGHREPVSHPEICLLEKVEVSLDIHGHLLEEQIPACIHVHLS